jgi:SAM-dependent methyltransferase
MYYLKKQFNNFYRHLKNKKDSKIILYAKIVSLTYFAVAIEKIFTNPKNPNPLKDILIILKKTRNIFDCYSELSEYQKDKNNLFFKKNLVAMHKLLWQEIWPNYISLKEYNNLVEYRGKRLDFNNINNEFKKKTVLDFGCGNGSVSVALLKRGAKFCHGVDFGKKNVETAKYFSKILKLRKKSKFTFADIVYYKPKKKYDFIVCSAVLHHLKSKKDILKTLKNITLACKSGTHFYFFLRGFSGIRYLAQDLCRSCLVNASPSFIKEILWTMGFSTNKMTHLIDWHKAVYLQTKPDEIINILKKLNFTAFKRLKGPHKNDLDLNQVNEHKHGKTKFGTGELRFICKYA